ncbi:hypothetical protein F7725_020846 [Dissostichus mawsoni]|uniref:tRNA (carboxymethyluridine(34)-5-O)-methyltransferase n=1 Tax=Dissostichus mawsoni TaxID=36200 RepID=A0A7J5YHR9_DISMA|nr:hypothetical protein F7725_020846 [Dissostichus mawsoni]
MDESQESCILNAENCSSSSSALSSKSGNTPQCNGASESRTLLQVPESHGLQLLSVLRSFREQGLLFDFTIKVQEQSFPCHRCVLAACSDFFRAMFEVDMRERGDGSVTLGNQCPVAVRLFLDFAYSGEMLITDSNVSVLSQACSNFLIRAMDLSNCLSLFSLAEAYGSASLLQSANEFVVQNFSELSKTQDFLDMQVNVLEACLRSDALNVPSEEAVMISSAIVSPASPCSLKLRAGRISTAACSLMPATTTQSYPQNTEENGEIRHSFCYHLETDQWKELGTGHGEGTAMMPDPPGSYLTSFAEKVHWSSVSPLPTAIYYPEASACGSVIYTLGSEVEITDSFNPSLDCFFSYDTQQDQWSRLVAEFGQFFHATLVKAVSIDNTLHICDLYLQVFVVKLFCIKSTSLRLSPLQSLVVANGGLGNGVSREELSAALKQMGEVDKLIMHPNKPYAFVTYRSEESARKAHINLNGEKLQCGENSVTLYLSYVDSVTCEEEASVPLPEGLVLVEDFVCSEEEALLLAAIDWSSTNTDVTAQKALKHRRVKHYGFEFRYDNNNVDKDKPLPAGIPQECLPVLERCVKNQHIDIMPDQLTVNQYESGQGIPPHVDTHSAFEDTIMSLSLGAKTVMEFRHPMVASLPWFYQNGASWITPRKFDMVPACEPQSFGDATPDLRTSSNLTLSKRGTRTSLTFRKIRHEPCRCAFPSACDSQGAPPAPSPPPPPSLPCCHADAALLEEQYVHRVYDAIASHFSSTRHSPWPRVCHFLSSLPPGSVLADVGCGNGKYLGVNPELSAVGCDRSSALVQICAERGFQAFVSDALSVPLREASCDACISIAVIHHFSTQERRLAAVQELVRLLKPGGRALIYVWAFEQEYNKQRSKYLKDQNKELPENHNPAENSPEESQEPQGKSSVHNSSHSEDNYRTVDNNQHVTDGKLSVHTTAQPSKPRTFWFPGI